MALEISRKDIPEGDLIEYSAEDRFIKLPILPYMELLGVEPISWCREPIWNKFSESEIL